MIGLIVGANHQLKNRQLPRRRECTSCPAWNMGTTGSITDRADTFEYIRRDDNSWRGGTVERCS